MIDAEIIRIKRALQVANYNDPALPALASAARDLLIATGGDIPELTPLPSSPADLRAYGFLAILKAEGRRIGYGPLTLEDQIVAAARAAYASFTPEARMQAENADIVYDIDFVQPFIDTPSVNNAEWMMATLGPAIDTAAILVVIGRIPAIPFEFMRLLRMAYDVGYGA